MTKETKNNHDHSEFGGIINNYDFYGYTSVTEAAKKIVSSWSFDRSCKYKATHRKKKGATNSV